MKAILNISVVTTLLFAATSQCFALMEIEDVTKSRARELGVTFRSNIDGENGTKVWLEFKPVGELKGFTRVELQINAEGKRLVSAPLQPSHRLRKVSRSIFPPTRPICPRAR